LATAGQGCIVKALTGCFAPGLITDNQIAGIDRPDTGFKLSVFVMTSHFFIFVIKFDTMLGGNCVMIHSLTKDHHNPKERNRHALV